MLRETQHLPADLSAGAPHRADKVSSSRRRFLGGTGFAVGAAIGSTMPFSNDLGSLIPHAAAQGAAPAPAAAAAAKGPQFLKFPGKNEGLVVLGDRPLVAETPESLLDDEIGRAHV